MDAFEAEYGYELRCPATWDQLLRHRGLLQRQADRRSTPKPVNGMSMHLKVGGQGMFHYMSLSAPYVIGPENTNLYWFDPDTMDPLVDERRPRRRAMETSSSWWTTGRKRWLAGPSARRGTTSCAATRSSPTPGGTCRLGGRTRSGHQGNVGTVQLPGTMAYVNPMTGEEYTTEEPNIVGNTTGGSWAGVDHEGLREPGSRLLLAGPDGDRGEAAVLRGARYRRRRSGPPSQIPPAVVEGGTGTIDDYVAQGWEAEDAEEYVRAYYDNFQNP